MAEKQIILLVENDENDILLIRRAFDKVGASNPLFVVRDGEAAIEYLSGMGKYFNRDEFPLPDVVLLDLKMPKVDGFEVLEWLRRESDFRSLIVVVLTTSREVYDVDKAYRLGANSFLVKPADFQQYPDTVRAVLDYWLARNTAPRASRPSQKPKAR